MPDRGADGSRCAVARALAPVMRGAGDVVAQNKIHRLEEDGIRQAKSRAKPEFQSRRRHAEEFAELRRAAGDFAGAAEKGGLQFQHVHLCCKQCAKLSARR